MAVAVPALAFAAGAAKASAAQGRQADAIELKAARFYRPSAAETLVDVFCRIPLALIDQREGTTSDATYTFAVSVRDSSGLELLAHSWNGRVAGELMRVPGAVTTEHFTFAAHAGRYTVDVAVTGAATGQVNRQRAEIGAFARAPAASDLVVATGIRPAADAMDTVPRGGEIRKGALFLETSGRPVLTPERSRLGYYVELYAARAESVTATVRVKSAAGQQIVATSPQRIAVSAGGGTTQGVVDLSGLPPGDYQLELTVATPDSEVVRGAQFGMAGFETAQKIAQVSPSTAVPPAPADLFAASDEAELDSLYMPLVYLMTAQEQGVFPGLTVDGKRAYLRRFWASRNPTPGAARNDAMVRFYEYVRAANTRYHEGGVSRVPGWRTDRGRIFITYGPPDDVLTRQQAGSTKPYEVWKYSRGRGKRFIFMDLTQFGNYSLIWTDERREPTLPNWRVLLGDEGVTDAFRF
jgi:GWxTD domain-containing protein